MKVQRLYWLTVGWFGLVAVANGWLEFRAGSALVAVVTALAGAVLVVSAALGTLRPEQSSAPAEVTLWLHAGLLAAGLYTTATILRLL